MTTKSTTKKAATMDIRAMVDQALELERRKKLIEAEQKDLEKQIRNFAKVDKDGKIPTDGGGWSVQYPCTDGSFVRVIKDGDTLVSKIAEDDEDLPAVRDAAGGAFGHLFTARIAYELKSDFRKEAAALAGEKADALIALVSKCGKTSVIYQVAKTPGE